jgi:murein tripeptide amidase MpaA
MAYFTYEELLDGVQQLAQHYAAKADLIELPHPSVEGRPVKAIAIGDMRGPNRPTAIFVGGIHAREWVPPDALLSLAADLLEASTNGTGLGYGGIHFDKATIALILSNLQLVILPCANPDGRVYSQTIDPNWRKNRKPNAGSACFGVDINRNFDVCWDFRRFFAPGFVSASDNPCDPQVYVGPSAASEPETQNIVWMLDHFKKAGWFIDVHAAIPAVFHGWGLDQNQSTNTQMTFLNPAFDRKRGMENDPTVYSEFIESADLAEVMRLAQIMGTTIKDVHGDAYDVGAAFSLYATSGASDDYAYSRHRADPAKGRVFGFTMECGHEFQPEPAERENVMREVSAALVAFAAGVNLGMVV